jgi:hypothetical protein
MVTEILDEVAACTNSAALRPLIPRLEQLRLAGQKRIEELEISREEIVLQGPSAREKHKADLAKARDELDELDAASRAAVRRLQDFERREAIADLEKTYKQTLLKRDRLVKLRAEFLGQLLSMKKMHEEGLELRKSIAAFNQAAHAAKRDDLRIRDPHGKFIEATGRNIEHPLHWDHLVKGLPEVENFKKIADKCGVPQ